MRIAILGGSFNPFHIGHALLADTAVTELGYDRVLVIPAANPPHKHLNGEVSAEDRLGMVQSFCADDPRFCAEDCELQRGGVSYTYDTLRYILEQYRGELEGKPGLLLGQEMAGEFGKWHCAAEIASIADLIVARRHPDADGAEDRLFSNEPSGSYTGAFISDDAAAAIPFPHRMLENALVPVSSTAIRARIAQNKSWRYLVPAPVFEYIKKHQLYGYTND